MDRMLAGYRKFINDVFPSMQPLFERLAAGQSPRTLWVGCADSRVDPALVTQSPPGELFVIRNAGNIVPPEDAPPGAVSSGIEYAVKVLNVKNVVVCGHSHCGLISEALHPETLLPLPHLRAWAEHACGCEVQKRMGHSPEETLAQAILQNVRGQLEHLRTYRVVRERLDRGDLNVYGAIHTFESGTLDIYDDTQGDFRPLSGTDSATRITPCA